ncbi:MAG: hypothetical protein IPK17_38540 [Chloroflexi bacterium]|uniref:hypothetical protein n=1 Tax=Candidatus Flexifilum breve TaxID=3140694 RepID=UPI003135EC7A|nr:hypothetical protein [Chloroflexota bacterium]
MSGKTLKLRSAPTLYINQDLRVDRENLVIRDVIAMQAGVEAIGHECQADLKTLEAMAALGNAQTRGLRMRFGHPGASENAAGKKIALAKNFYVSGGGLRHDMHLLESARISPVFSRDPLEYILDVAEKHPAELAESAVINAELVWTMPNGREVTYHNPRHYTDHKDDEPEVEIDPVTGRPFEALTPLPVIRPLAFYYVDVVNEGALTHDGLFESRVFAAMFAGTANAYADEVFDLLDRWREEFDIPVDRVPDKVHQVMERYLHARGYNSMARGIGARTRQFDSKPIAEEDGAVVTTPDPVEDAEKDELDEAVAAAEATSEHIDEQTAAPEQAEATDETVPAEEFRALQQQYDELAAKFDKLTKLTVLNTRNIERLLGAVRRIDGEPVVGLSVPRTNGSRVFGAGLPPQALVNQTPGAISGRSGAQALDFDADPEGATLAAILERQQTLR